MAKDYLRIKESIKEQGFTYESLGNAVGLSKTSIARIASGDQTPSFDTLKLISDTLGISVGDLFKKNTSSMTKNEIIDEAIHLLNAAKD